MCEKTKINEKEVEKSPFLDIEKTLEGDGVSVGGVGGSILLSKSFRKKEAQIVKLFSDFP